MLLKLTTMRRMALLLFLFLVWTPAAYAWSWPVQGPVLNPFSYDEAHPYAAGQHRGIDIGADADGATVVAPAAGTVSFAGTVPTSGKSVTIETQNGYSVTLTHLGSIGVAKGTSVSEGGAVGTIGPSGTPEVDGPYLHLGVRVTTDPNGYVDPLGLLPVPTGTAPDTGATTSQPSSGSASSAASGSASSTSPSAPPATQPVDSQPASQPASSIPTSTTRRVRTHDAHHQEREHTSQTSAETRSTSRAQRRPATRPVHEPASHSARQMNVARRPVVETAAPTEPIRLGAGHEIDGSVPVNESASARTPAPETPLPLALNGAAAVVAVGAALMAARRRRRRFLAGSIAAAQVLELPACVAEPRPLSRAA